MAATRLQGGGSLQRCCKGDKGARRCLRVSVYGNAARAAKLFAPTSFLFGKKEYLRVINLFSFFFYIIILILLALILFAIVSLVSLFPVKVIIVVDCNSN